MFKKQKIVLKSITRGHFVFSNLFFPIELEYPNLFAETKFHVFTPDAAISDSGPIGTPSGGKRLN